MVFYSKNVSHYDNAKLIKFRAKDIAKAD